MAYLLPVIYRKNLKILERSYVIKIQIDESSKKVKGVIFTRNNRTFIAREPHREAILSAGVIGSPQILMLSGIGPSAHLQSLGIPVIQNLSVGSKFLDHAMTILAFTSNATWEPALTVRESIRELLKAEGPLTIPLAADGVGFFQTPV